MKKPKKSSAHRIIALHAYVGNDDEAQKYVQEIKAFAMKCNQSLGDFVLDAVEAYCKSKSIKPLTAPKIESQTLSLPILKQSPNDYSELDDPPAPQIDATQIPDSRPKL
jgi:hypothetical protein